MVWLIVSMIGVAGLLVGLLWSGWRTIKVDNTLQGVCLETAKTSSLVFIILMGAAMLTAAFRGFGGEELVKHFLTGLPGGFWGQFFTVMAVIFILGFFLDFIEIAVVVVPIVAPILLTDPGANVTAVWLGVMIGVNMQTSFLTPPFGFALFYLRGVAPAFVKTLSMYKGVIPFILMQLLVLVIVATSPRLVNYLPQRVTLGASTAPPPINPSLQYCIEQYMTGELQESGAAIKAAIAKARTLDVSALPDELRNDLSGSFAKADGAFALLDNVNKAEDASDKFAVDYAPLHHHVRAIQIGIRRDEALIKELKLDIQRIPDDDKAGLEKMKEQLATTEAHRKSLQATIPAQWDVQHKEFRKLVTADHLARLKYRRDVDQAYIPVHDALRVIEGTGALAALKPEIEALRGIINSQPMDKAAAAVEAVLTKVNVIPGGNPVRSELAKVRRNLTGRTPNKDEALKALDKALPVYASEMAWRQKATQTTLPGLKAYDAAIRETIGLRKQEKIPHRIVPTIAACTAYQRDVSLFF